MSVAAAIVAVALAAGPAAADHDLLQRVSAGAGSRGNANAAASFLGASADGKRVFFSSAERLALGDTDSQVDIYERSSGTTTRISTGVINGNGAFAATFARASTDGTRVFFTTSEQLVANDTDNQQDVYERSRGTTTLVSAGAINGNGPNSAQFAGASTDGAHVFFTTSESLASADTDSAQDVYDRFGGTTTLVSAGQINGNANLGAVFSGTSAAGARVWFATAERLVSIDTDSSTDIYQRANGQTSLVSRGQINGNGAFPATFLGASADGLRRFYSTFEQLASTDTDNRSDIYSLVGTTVEQVSVGQINGNSNFDAVFNGLSADGSKVFFLTLEKLTTDDTDGQGDVYERSAGATTRVSVGAINGNGNLGASFSGASKDGAHVFFVTGESLVSADTDTTTDVYERFGNTTQLVSASAITGASPQTASFGCASADGLRVIFTTSEPLVSSDTDAKTDVYEREGGTTSPVSVGGGDFAVTFRGCTPSALAVYFETQEKILASDLDSAQDVYGAYAFVP